MATYEAKKYATIPIAATQVADGSVTNSEYQFINTLASNAQTQITARAPLAGATFTGGVRVNDSQNLNIGSGTDLVISHDTNNSKINNTTGELRIAGDSIKLMNQAENETHLTAAADGAVGLRHNNVEKLVTSASGVTVSGTLAATAVTGDASGMSNLPTGPTGPPGGTGPTGPSGPTGPTGPAGTSGIPVNSTAVGALKYFALYYDGSGTDSNTSIGVGTEVVPSTYNSSNKYLSSSVEYNNSASSSGPQDTSSLGYLVPGFAGTSSGIQGKTRATEAGTWRCISSAIYNKFTTSGNSGGTYTISGSGLFQRIS